MEGVLAMGGKLAEPDGKLRRIEMTPEELKREGKYSDEYQNELAGCFGIMIVVLLACIVVFGVAKVVIRYMGA